VTFEVNTNQAQRLALAQQVGKLSLTLRGFGEAVDGPMKPVTAGELSDLEAGPVQQVSKVRVRRGTEVRDVRIDGKGETPDEATSEAVPVN
jgi:Flp pilus assembly protein CpaB